MEISPADISIIRDCVRLIAETNLIEDPEFTSRIGVSRSDLITHLDQPTASWIADDEMRLVVGNCLNEVCYGLNVPVDVWRQRIQADRRDVEAAFEHWEAMCTLYS